MTHPLVPEQTDGNVRSHEENVMTRIIDTQQMESTSKQVAEKLQSFHDSLSGDERFVLDLAIRQVAAGGSQIDTEGFRAAEYEDEFGYKGRPGSNPAYQPNAGGGAAVPVILMGALFVLTAGTVDPAGEYPS
jgi:hypothetical protein